ncbi:MAG TPA: glycosyltransferase [Acetobacteraceae bacterium]|nr:glycosyltransferase [Acetobacteraceae bacterium]
MPRRGPIASSQEKPTDSGTALAAWEKGEAALASGDVKGARRWFDRAHRLAPDEDRITLSLALACLRAGENEEGAALLEALAERHDRRVVWLALAAARRRAGNALSAAAALGRALSGHVWGHVWTRPEAEVMGILDAVTLEAAYPGWCALGADGTLHLGIVAAKDVTIALDGTAMRHSGGRQRRLKLRPGWERRELLTVMAGGQALLGSPIRVAALRRTEGFAETSRGGITGWAWHPAEPDRAPVLTVWPAGGARPAFTVTARDEGPRLAGVAAPLTRPRGFTIPAARLRGLAGPIAVRGRDGRDLTGSPLEPGRENVAAVAKAKLAAQRFAAPSAAKRAKEAVDIIVPVHGAMTATLACLASVQDHLPQSARLIVVEDGVPEPAFAQALAALAERGSVHLVRRARAGGFPSACNEGIRAARPGADILLLNSDTLVGEGWVEGLRAAALSAPDIGTATPFSNEATIVSYPDPAGGNKVPDRTETAQLARLAARLHHGKAVEIPTGIGFCLYIRRACLTATGLFREDVFAQGYGEENDFCVRARHLGWRHVAAPGVFVAHLGGRSFGAAGKALAQRNLARLNRLHPGYDAEIAAHIATDPLFAYRRRLDEARFAAGRAAAGAVLLIGHGRGGGVETFLRRRQTSLRAAGLRPILLRPAVSLDGRRAAIVNDDSGEVFPNLRFTIPDEIPALTRLLKPERVRSAELHHLVGHHHAILELCQRLHVPYDAYLHDYAAFCARIALVGPEGRYCGEPEPRVCAACVADAGSEIEEAIAPEGLIARSSGELAGARHVIAPARDVAARYRRHFPGLAATVVPWEDDSALPDANSRPFRTPRTVVVIGAISIAKGYNVLLSAARDAAWRNLKLRFALVGYSHDDRRLIETGRVFVTGAYHAEELPRLIAAQEADFAFLPSVWPETWCFTLSEAWRAGLDVAAFDLGAQAERIRATGRGWLLPLGLTVAALNDSLCKLSPRPFRANSR